VATKAPTSNGIALALSCAAQFMVVLDIAIVNVALPSIQQDLGIEQRTCRRCSPSERSSPSSSSVRC
jgi:hypothetical protein